MLSEVFSKHNEMYTKIISQTFYSITTNNTKGLSSLEFRKEFQIHFPEPIAAFNLIVIDKIPIY